VNVAGAGNRCRPGLVADSDPEAEYQETVNKAKGLLRALEIAETQL
jgi:anthranilate synthase component 1